MPLNDLVQMCGLQVEEEHLSESSIDALTSRTWRFNVLLSRNSKETLSGTQYTSIAIAERIQLVVSAQREWSQYASSNSK